MLRPNLLVLLMYEARHLLEAFLVVSLGTEIDDVSGQTSHAPLTIRGAGALFSLSVKRVEGADGVVKKRSVNFPLQLSWESGGKLHSRPLGEISLDENLPAVCLREGGGLGVCHRSRLKHLS